jgi:NitT/TauT family transport system ATP-binding protein
MSLKNAQPAIPEVGSPTDAQKPEPPLLQLQNVTRVYAGPRGPTVAVENISFAVQPGDFVVLVGASGCGKTTLLNLIAGLDRPTHGEISVRGRPVTGPGPDRMMMFQEHGLFPWLDVIGNVMFGLRHLKHLTRRQCRETAHRYLDLVELNGHEHSRIHELSSGMRQRVALARALAPDPEIILFDEPFGALDALTRERFYAQLQAIMAKTRKTAVFVTHNVREAACLGDRVIVLASRPGRIQAVVEVPLPRPRDFYDPEVSRLAGKILHALRESENQLVAT